MKQAYINTVTVLFVASVTAGNLDAQPQDENPTTDWHQLFDGETLNGWEPVVDNGAFRVSDGKLLAGGTKMNHLFYSGPIGNGQFKNFELKLDVMTTPGSNSGVFFHTRSQEGFLLKGYEAQINATHKDKRKTGSLLDVKHISSSPAADGEWFEYHLIVEGQRIAIKVNGETTVDYTQPPHPKRSERRKLRVLSSGQIALQAHDPDSLVYFRNIRLRVLPDTVQSEVRSLNTSAKDDHALKVEVVVGNLLPSEGGPRTTPDSPLSSPFGIDFDSQGNMVIVELEGGRVHQLSRGGKLSQISGDGSKSYAGDGGPATQATFNGMHNVAITPNDDILIADSWNHCIRRISASSGEVETIAGTGAAGFSGDGGPADQATFDFVMCITLDSTGDKVYIADLKNRRVRMVDLKTGVVSLVAGNGERGVPYDGARAVESPLVDPRAVAVDSRQQVYVLERGGHALRMVTPEGKIHTVAGTGEKGYRDGPALRAQLNSPKHLCVDEHDNVYIADDQNRAIRKYDPHARTVTTVLGRGVGIPPVELKRPHGVCVENGILYVVDTGNNRILRVVPTPDGS